ncbi:MAG TPA: TAXI family TRAP transporter solute-binding subunit [Verrucomicrobiae bacterium]|nr:TAXI family TRAP transporter solute-binding subunit [Verrucomicrobiae bacterium]
MPPTRRIPTRRYLLSFSVALVVFTLLLTWLVFAIFQPTPPRSVTMAIDPQGSYNAEVAQRYRELLAREGIELKLVPSKGAVESIALLRDPKSHVSIAIIPSGITDELKSPELISLGTLYYEPLWAFTRGQSVRNHEQLTGKRISIGPEGSASHALAQEFLARVGIINDMTATLLSLPALEGAAKLESGDIDALALVEPWETPEVHELLNAQDVNLDSVPRADAFVALYPFLQKLTLPAGVGNMQLNRPPNDVVLLATKASLIVRSDLHPAIQYRLLEAASKVHSTAGLFHFPGQFPAPETFDLPLGKHARQFYKTGPPFLQRHLPFWLAVFAEQLLVLLIPMLGVVYPVLRFSPALYSWFQNNRIYKLYSELMQLENDMASSPSHHANDFIQRLEQLEERASHLSLPLPFQPRVYALRTHIGVVREKLEKRSAQEIPASH